MFKRISFLLFLFFIIGLTVIPVDSSAVLVESGDVVRLDFNLSYLDQPQPPYEHYNIRLLSGPSDPIDISDSFYWNFYNGYGSVISSQHYYPTVSTFVLSVDNFTFSGGPLTTFSGYILLFPAGSFDFVNSNSNPNNWVSSISFSNIFGTTEYVPLEISFIRDINPPASVPEPSTMLLLGSGLVGLVGYGRKRLKK